MELRAQALFRERPCQAVIFVLGGKVSVTEGQRDWGSREERHTYPGSTRLLCQKGEGVGLIHEPEVLPRVGRPAAVDQRPVEVRHERADVPGAVLLRVLALALADVVDVPLQALGPVVVPAGAGGAEVVAMEVAARADGGLQAPPRPAPLSVKGPFLTPLHQPPFPPTLSSPPTLYLASFRE
jgi:hypothetical protein